MTFYRFVRLEGLPALRDALESEARALGLRGTVLLAEEGINATLTGARTALEALQETLDGWPGLRGLRYRFSTAAADNPVFHRLKVRVRQEIVRLDQPGVAPGQRTGEHVDARRWNALLDDPDVLVIDARNQYEVAIGTFPGTRDPGTRAFRDLPAYVAAHLDPARHPRVAMFCTGGIRCEKASAWMLEQGFATVYQLEGGILEYLATVPDGESRWTGECFVFDQRVSVDDRLGEGSFEQCFACRRPLAAADLGTPAYQAGVSCPYCIDAQTENQRAAFVERRRQVELAERRGTRHVGPSRDTGSGPLAS